MLPNSFQFLGWRAARVLSAVLVLQLAVVHGFTRREVIGAHKPLAGLPAVLGNWTLKSEGVIEKEVQDVLRAHDVLTRAYVSPETPVPASLFVAYFETLRAGQAPHSPKNCLPGSGWVPSAFSVERLEVPGRTAPIEVNRYVVAKGDTKSLVMYWYQSRDRVVASEYRAKFYSVADAIRYNRTDTALVRVIVPVIDNNLALSEQAASDFIRALFVPLRAHFPA